MPTCSFPNQSDNHPLKGLIRIFLTVALLLPATTGCGKQTSTIEVFKSTISAATTWSGIVEIKGDVLVDAGVTLTITPGTVIKFHRIDKNSDQNMFATDSPYYPQAELIIRGRLVAIGTRDNNIVFTSAAIDAKPWDWGAINFLGSNDSIIEYTKIFFAYNGIHAHGSQVVVRNCEIARNGVGISFKKEEETEGVSWYGIASNFTIEHNRIYQNKGGIGLRNSSATIRGNEITDNKFFGIFPKEHARAIISGNAITGNKKGVYLYQAQGITLTENNIYDNTDYNIAIAEAQDFPVNARNNYFGTISRDRIHELIFDHQDDEELGVIEIEPFLEKPIQLF